MNENYILKKKYSSLLVELGQVQLYTVSLEEKIDELNEKLKDYEEMKTKEIDIEKHNAILESKGTTMKC